MNADQKKDNVAYLLKGNILQPAETTAARERLCKQANQEEILNKMEANQRTMKAMINFGSLVRRNKVFARKDIGQDGGQKRTEAEMKSDVEDTSARQILKKLMPYWAIRKFLTGRLKDRSGDRGRLTHLDVPARRRGRGQNGPTVQTRRDETMKMPRMQQWHKELSPGKQLCLGGKQALHKSQTA